MCCVKLCDVMCAGNINQNNIGIHNVVQSKSTYTGPHSERNSIKTDNTVQEKVHNSLTYLIFSLVDHVNSLCTQHS